MILDMLYFVSNKYKEMLRVIWDVVKDYFVVCLELFSYFDDCKFFKEDGIYFY